MITRKRSVLSRRYTPSVPSGPPAHRLVVGTFPALEPAFLRAVRELKKSDPLRPVEVLVGSNLVALYLRRRAADELGAVANLRFLTFLDLARAILPGAGLAPALPLLGEALLAREALAATPEARAFDPLRDRPAFRQAFVRTADDLRDAGIPAGDLPRLLAGAAATPDRRGFLAALAAAVVEFEKRRARFADATGLLDRAGSVAIPRSDDPLLVYGLYDLGGLREGLLANVASARPVSAFVPDDGEAEPAGALPVRRPLFERVLRVPAERASGPPALAPRIVVAPSEGSEARETVRELLAAVDAGIPLHRIAILVRNPERQEAALTAELELRSIPFFRPAGPGFSRSPLGRAARTLVRLAAEGFPADAFRELLDLLETLGLFPEVGPAAPSPARLGTALGDLGFEAGRDDLAARLSAAKQRLARPLRPADDPDGWFASRRDAELGEIRALESSVDAVAKALPPADATSWSEWSRRLRHSFGILFDEAAGRDRLEPALEAVAALESVEPGASVDAKAVAALLPEALDLSPQRRGRFERDGVALLSAVSARGLLFDAVLIPGLVEQSFPRPVRPDPLLFDAERRAIAAASGRPLPTRADERPLREERFLFGLARAAARRRLVLLAAARDVSTDRPRLLSPFLLNLTGDATRRALLSRELGRSPRPLPEGVVWHPAGRLVAAGPPLDAEDALRRALALAPGLRKSLPDDAEGVTAALARAAARRLPFFTEYEGAVGREASGLRLRSGTVSASRLERFAGCAYRAFLERGLRLEARPEGEDEGFFGLDALTRGNALHAAVRDLTRSLVAAGRTFADLGADEIGHFAADAAARAVDAAVAADRSAPPPVLVEMEKEALAALLAALVGHLAASEHLVPPAGAEVRFGRPTGDPAERDEDPALSTDAPVEVDGLPFRVRLHGRIDRLDREGGRARVVDYKTGKPEPFKETNRRRFVVAGGERLQLPVYALAARLLGAVHVESEYLFVRKERESVKVTATRFDEAATNEAIAALKEILRLAEEAVGAGLYLPKTVSLRTAAPCLTCDFAAVCGPGHARVYDRKWEGDAARGRRNPLTEMGGIK
jgi:ATP-dependent helicase/nuclease subunit B